METDKPLDARWTNWLRNNMRLGTDLVETLTELRKAGFSDQAIAAGLDAVRPQNDATELMHVPPLIKRMPPKLSRFDSDKVDLYIYDDFLSQKECDKLNALIAHHLRPSTVSFDNGDRYFRTSQSSHLSHLKSPVAIGIDEKICKTIGIRVEYSEGIQAQRYDVGQQFKAHCDFFMPGTNAYSRFAGLRGNRTWTFMVYLNDGMEGGATRFHNIDYAVQPRTGTALLWYNLNADGSPNQDTLHSGEPVLRGNKVIITKWFRVFGDGPLFFE
jgi:prolyl 4-hydroxylase